MERDEQHRLIWIEMGQKKVSETSLLQGLNCTQETGVLISEVEGFPGV